MTQQICSSSLAPASDVEAVLQHIKKYKKEHGNKLDFFGLHIYNRKFEADRFNRAITQIISEKRVDFFDRMAICTSPIYQTWAKNHAKES